MRRLFLVLILCLSALVAVPTLLLAVEAPWGVELVFDRLSVAGHDGLAQARIITDNVEAWYARWYLLNSAQRSIDCTYFIVERDAFGRAMIGALLRKAKAGVPVRLMLDARGSGQFTRQLAGYDSLQELLQHPGVQVKIFNPIGRALLSLPKDVRNVVASNHDKLLIVDGEWFITGGRNISADYLTAHEDRPGGFRDTDVLLRGGPIAREAKQAFDEEFDRPGNAKVRADLLGNWNSKSSGLEIAWNVMQRFLTGDDPIEPEQLPGAAARDLVEEMNQELAQYPRLRSQRLGNFDKYEPFFGDRAVPVKLLDKHSRLGTRNDITANLVRLIDASTWQITLQNPYVVLTSEARAALRRASERGVPIVISTNGPASFDHLVVQATFLREWKQMLAELPTARILVFNGPGTIHSKVFTFDDRVAAIGSYNMDPMSEQINSEEVCLVRSPEFARRMRLRIEQMLKDSTEWRIRRPGAGAMEMEVGPSPEAVAGALEVLKNADVLKLLRPML